MIEGPFVAYLKVGQGNCTLIGLGEGRHLLVDAYGRDDAADAGLFQVVPFLLGQLPQKDDQPFLDALLVTHGHQDHIAAFPAIMNSGILIGEIWYPDFDRFEHEDADPGEEYEALYKEIGRRRKLRSGNFLDGDDRKPGDRERPVFTGNVLNSINGDIVPDFFARILSPFKVDEQDPDSKIHDVSVVCHIALAGQSFMFAGDTDRPLWEGDDDVSPPYGIVPRYGDKAATWLKAWFLLASHHGSEKFFDLDHETARDNPYLEHLQLIDPAYVVISSEKKAPERHVPNADPPHPAAIKHYEGRVGSGKVLYTCEGNIFVWKDGEGWKLDANWTPPEPDDDSSKGTKPKGEFSPRRTTSQHAPGRFG